MRDNPEYQNITIDTDLHYDLDMSKFPGLDDPQKLREPTLMIAPETFYYQLHDTTEICDVDDVDGDVDDDYDGIDDNVCVFCDALNESEEDNSLPEQALPCYLQDTLYIFHDAHNIDCQTVEVFDEKTVDINSIPGGETKMEQEESLHNGNMQCEHETNMDHESSVISFDTSPWKHVIVENLTFTELSSCHYEFNSGIHLVEMSFSSPMSSAHMDASITEQLPFFIDLVDELSPILSPSGSVRTRRGNNSVCDSNTVEILAHTLAQRDGNVPIYTSSKRFLHSSSSPVLTRWS